MRRVLWLLLAVSGGISWYAYEHPSSQQVEIMFGMLATSFVLGMWTSALYGFALRPTLAVLAVFAGGQFWPIVWALVLVGWTINGFAP